MIYHITRQFAKALDRLREELVGLFQQQISATRDSIEATRENKRDPLPIPLPVFAETQTTEAEKAEQRAQHDKDYTLQVFLTIGTWLAFIAASIYAAIAKSQLDEMKNATTATQAAAYAACLGAKIARSSLLEYQRSARDAHLASVAAYAQAVAAIESEKAFVSAQFRGP